MSQVVQDEKRERLTRVVAAASLAASSIYIVWRWGWTLDTGALWFSVPIALAETHAVLVAALLTFTAWTLRERSVLPVLPGRTVDVFVTVSDEPLATIRKTALAAREIRYPHTTWLLDDGHRDELRTVAREMGIRYLRRDDRANGKAGNLNHALQHARGEFILQLDADHVALPQIVDQLIGFFADEGIAFVQSPQDFYNTDAFSDDTSGTGRQLWGDQQLFFNVLQPGKDRANAAVFVGSCAMLRRAAVDDVGGFGVHSSTMGTETSMRLHARGWRSAYLNENLAFGLAPSTAHAYQMQQLHRAQGGMELLRRLPPLSLPGLTGVQRLEYFGTLSSPLGSVQRLVFYLAPVVFLTTGVFPIRASLGVFALMFVPVVLLRAASFKLLTRGQGSLLLSDRYWMAKFFTHLLSVRAFFTPRRFAYRPLANTAGTVPLSTVAPQLTLIGVTALALGWATYARTLGYSAEVPGWGLVALFGAVLLALWHAGLAAHVVQLSLAGRHRRAEHRFAESLSVALRVMRADGKLSSTDIAVTDDLTATGAALRCMYPIPDGARVEISLPLSSGEVHVRGHVVRHGTSETQLGTVHLAGVEFDSMPRETRDAIELHCAQHAMPLDQQRQRQGVSSSTIRRLRDLRGERRVEVGMPARVFRGAGEGGEDLGVGLLEDVSPRGGRVLLDHPVSEGTLLTLQIPGSTVRASGRVVFVHAMQTGLGMRFVAGFQTALDPAATAPAAPAGPSAAPWYAAAMRFAARAASAAAAGSARATSALAPRSVTATERPSENAPPAGARPAAASRAAMERLASGTRAAAESVAGSSKAVGERVVAGTKVVADRVVESSRGVAERVALGTRAAAGSLSAGTRAAVGKVSAGSSSVGAGFLQGSRTAVERFASVSRTAGARLSADLQADAIRAVETAKAMRAASSARAAAAARLVREVLPAAGGEAGAQASLEPLEASARAHRESIATNAAALARALTSAGPIRKAGDAAAVPESDPDRAIEMQIDGDFSFPFELTVGATLLITEAGHVAADIATVHAIILGRYTGTLRASRSIRVGPRARVDGLLEAPELEIADGAVVNGLSAQEAADETSTPTAGAPIAVNIPASDDLPEPRSSALEGGLVAPNPADPATAPAARVMPDEAATVGESGGEAPSPSDDEIFVASPIFTGGVTRGS